jgi:aminoglycoside phosphotransferase (APT) family kinase protein
MGTTSVRSAHRFDEAQLDAWLGANIQDYAGPLRVEEFKGGQSNPTYQLVTPARRYVLRRKPPGKLLKGAHAVDREAKVIKALGKTGFPVPRVYGVCLDESVLGTWFYVMEHIEGRIFWDASFPNVPTQERPQYFQAMNATLARLHCADYEAIGLGDFGRPAGYFSRQIGLWTKQYLQDTDAGRDANMDRIIEWLPGNIPASDEATIVHGDYRCDNMVFHPTQPRILAVLDWELSTLGHPVADFCSHAMMYRMPPHIVAGLGNIDPGSLNIPTEQEYVAAYCQNTGRESLPEYDFGLAFSFFRMAAILHGIKGRAIRGTAASAKAQDHAAAFPQMATLAWEEAKRAGAS